MTQRDNSHENSSSVENIAALAEALADPVRIQIVEFLIRRSRSDEPGLAVTLGLSRSVLAEHLQKLKDIGFIFGDIGQAETGYTLNPAALAPLIVLLSRISAHQPNLANLGGR